jgi:hypothetical protein
MKVLNRPMFRYGGPIKEGIMSGIKERVPFQQGGNYLSRLGGAITNFYNPLKKTKAATNVAKKTGILQKAKQLFTGQKTTTGPGTVTIPAQPGKTVYQGAYSMRVPPSAARTVEKMGPAQVTTQLAPFGPGGPTNQNIYAALQRGIVPTVGAGGKVLSAVKPYTGSIVIAGTMYSVLKPDGTPKSVDELSAESGADGNKIIEKVKEKITTGGTGDGIELSDKERRLKNVERYRDIMDIKGMNKAAAYDSLIAASQAVNEAGGDFKESIKDGSLISKIIQSTSKAFDKPAKTKDAIDTLILKGEIEKDIKASDPSNILDAEYKRAKIAESKEKLNPSFNTLKAGYGKDNKGQSGIDLAAAEYSENQGQTFRGNIISKSDFNEIKADIKEKSGAVDEITIITSWTNATIKDKDVPDGNYTVGDKIVTIKDNVVIDVE